VGLGRGGCVNTRNAPTKTLPSRPEGAWLNAARSSRCAVYTPRPVWHHPYFGGALLTWFKVDDSFHSHPKVLAASPAALGLWVVAGSWSGSNLSDGFVPDHVLPRLVPDSVTLAKELTTAGLWKRVRGGYRFHDWSDFNPESGAVLAEREAARQRMRAVRARRKEGETNDKQEDFKQGLNKGRAKAEQATSETVFPAQPLNGSAEQQANVRELFGNPDPTRPELLRGRSKSSTYDRVRAASEPPSPRCPEHQENPTEAPCGRCADARRSRTRWDMADSERRRTAPQCRSHRGQPANNCALCRSEALAAQEQA
jgi:hypothetical protein